MARDELAPLTERWSPGDLSRPLPRIEPSDIPTAVANAEAARRDWANTPLPQKITHLRDAEQALLKATEELAHGISLEVGKPLTESRAEVSAVIQKFSLTIADAHRYLPDEVTSDGPHPALIRRQARGPAAVICPFNFPLHLGHGATIAHLLAGNPVLFKPSPYAAALGTTYGNLLEPLFPPGVFQVVQGGAQTGEALALHPKVRAVCFTGSTTVGRQLAQNLAADLSKDLALELGGSNALIVCADADIEQAATAAAEGACLTAGQRCNATSRIILERSIARKFQEHFLSALASFQLGDPLLTSTRLGPVISADAVARYQRLTAQYPGQWILPGQVQPMVDGRRGHYLHPAAVLRTDNGVGDQENFLPIVSLFIVADLEEAIHLQSLSADGLTASIFTRSEQTFQALGRRLEVGNLYANLPTTFSPSTLPFGGIKDSGNGRPGGRGFLRFTTTEQAVQWTKWSSI